MLSVLKFLWGSTAGKVTFAVTIALFVVGVGLAYAAGSNSGYADGFEAGKKSRDQEVSLLEGKVTTLVGLVNTKREAEATKIDKVEAEASDAAVDTQKKLAADLRERDAIIARYEARTPTVTKEACGLSVETVRAINQLIDNANDETIIEPSSAGGIASDSGPDPAVPELVPPTLQEGAAP